ncbi:DUF2141 domain-containing protein [Flammeovirga kamogawensis]|uniref:DUF2141 domain-containing protein n=1 Tax=Flammeovirga kamogawensis TaxID=373891 RepID=A0ABX8GSY8_9BACT|nr:DUF2141 domain-containing protein [Flammeovirga kamogawensis]MBB6462999.1 uncharacterized protein (DUF2141 family) [Flammeovirga kamogawensis]QWG06524.1 DUF2141 domain-containing protein [Flammeovirga kamogawensis]TRX68352.1 DUF2141 domain-containing protein [Flammeovirga kamogawensis]
MKIKHLIVLLLCFSQNLFAQETSNIHLTVEGLRNTDGFMLVQVVDKDLNSILETKGVVSDKVFTMVLEDIAPGTYGIRICHDEDENDDMTNNWIGLPKEGFGFSWDKKVKMKEPDFEEYAFQVNQGQVTKVRIVTQYL